MTKIDQFIPVFSTNDAVGDEVLAVRDLLRLWGFDSDIYARYIAPGCEDKAINYLKINLKKDRISIFHYGIWDEVMNLAFKVKGRKVLVYHNVTPEAYYTDYNEALVVLLRKAREKLTQMPGLFDMVITKSNFSMSELDSLGFHNIQVMPYIINFNKYNVTPSEITLNKQTKNKILYVGRVAPNKMIDNLIMVFYYLVNGVDPDSQLAIVGDYESKAYNPYYMKLMRLIRYLNLGNVCFCGQAGNAQIVSYYKWADVFVTMSEHEGFCIPLLESMYFNVPVLARNSTAVPETMGDSGILIDTNNFHEIAELIKICIDDKELRRNIQDKQKERLVFFNEEKILVTFKKYIEALTGRKI